MNTKGRSAVARAALICAASSAALIAGSAHAQPVSTEATGVEELVVTAEKRETQLQRTPAAITAISETRIELQNITGVEQLQFNVPSMVFGQQTGFSFITLRGIGTDVTDISSEPSVATYQDGVYTGSLLTQSLPEFDLQRIEVLRGPQGTLYGRNATGGVINYITKAPSFEPEVNLGLTLGTYKRGAIEGGATGALVPDKLAYRVSFRTETREGYRKNLNLGIREDDLDQWGGRAALLYTPNESFSATWRADYLDQKTSNPYTFLSGQPLVVFGPLDLLMSPAAPLGVFSQPASYFTANPGLLSPQDIARLNGGSIAEFAGFSSRPGPLPPNPNETTDVSTAVPTRSDVQSGGTSITLDWDLGGVNVKSITGFRYGKMDTIIDSGGIPTANVYFNPLYQSSNQWTQEFDISGSGFDDRLTWLLGAFYFHDRTKFAAHLFLPVFDEYLTANISLGSAGPFAFDLSQPILDLFSSPQLLASPIVSGPNVGGPGTLRPDDISTIPGTAFLGFRAIQKSESAAAFAQANYRLTDRLRASAGLRYTRDEKNVDRTVHSNLLVFLGATGGLCHNQKDRKSWDAMTGTAGLDYDLAERTMVYAKYARGYKAGGYSGNDCAQPFNPEYLSSYELGVKSVFGDGQFLVNAAAFYYDYTDIQFTTFVQNATARTNAGGAELYGLEAEFQVVPASLPGLSFDGSASWIRSEYTEGNPFSADGLYPDTSQRFRLDIRGNDLMRAPRFKMSAGAQYAADLGNGGSLTLRGEAAWTDTIHNDVFNGQAPFQEQVTQPSYWLVNARATWRSDDGHYQVQAFGENLTNEHYATNRISFNAPPTALVVAGQYAPPRTFGVRLSMRR